MQILAMALRALAALLRLLPLRRRVAFLSRQSSDLSLDYRLLIAELQGRLGPDAIVVCLCEPETKNVASFAAGTLKQLYLACTSRVVVVDGYVPAVCVPRKDDRTTVIQLWHALGAVKKFGYQCLDTPAGRSSESARVARMHRNYDYVIAGGPGAVPAFAEAFDYPPGQVLPLGLPRLDYLLDADEASPRRAAMREAAARYPFLTCGKRIVLYAPTLRKGEGYNPDWLSASVREVACGMEGADGAEALLVVTGHPLNGEFDRGLLSAFPFVRCAEGVPTIDLLGFADEVVTDYSAVAFEAGALRKPLRFHVPDLERYRTSPGLNIEPADLTQAFIDSYLAGQGATARIADLIEGKLATHDD